MPRQVPTPVAAALGLVPTVLDGVRRLPSRAVQVPVLAISSALAGLDKARRDYDELAERGERLLARLRGTSFDRVEDAVEDRLDGTPLARPYDAVEDALEDAGEAVQRVASKATRTARTAATRTAGRGAQAAGSVTDLGERAAARATGTAAGAAATATKRAGRAADAADGAAGQAAGQPAAGTAPAKHTAPTAGTAPAPAAEQPKGEPTPPAPPADDTRVGTAANADVMETVEQVVERTPTADVDHDALPLPDYDHMTLGSLRGRLRSLTVEQLVQLRDYEKQHASRLPVVTMLDNRIAKLATDAGATTSDAPPSAVAAPEKQAPASGGSTVQPSTGGPAQNPPSQGVPTNPAQPRSGGSGSANPNG